MATIERINRAGNRVALEDNRRGQFDYGDSNPWFTVCVDHGGVCSHETRKLAESFLSVTEEWCPDCQEELCPGIHERP